MNQEVRANNINFGKIGFCAILAILGYVFSWKFLKFDPFSLLLPFGILVSIYSTKEILEGTLEGTFIPYLTASLMLLSLGLFAFFYVPLATAHAEVAWQPVLTFLSWYLLFGCTLASVYQLLQFPARESPALRISVKTSALAGLAIIWKILWKALIPDVRTVLMDAVFCGFVFSAVGSALSSLSLARGPKLRTAGRRFGLSVLMFLAGALLALYLFSLRQSLMVRFGANFPIFEWMLVSAVIGFAALGLIAGATEMSESLWLAKWMKHTQIAGLCSDKELEDLSAMARDFIEKGDKSRIAVYLANLGERANIHPHAIATSLRGLLNYADEELPWLVRKKVARGIHLQNMEMRRKVLQAAIEKLEEAARYA